MEHSSETEEKTEVIGGVTEKEEIEIEKKEDDVYSELDELETVSGKFRFQGQRVLLTYKTHLDKAAFWKWLCEEKKWPPKKIYIAHENGDQACKYLHSHVAIDFGKRRDTINCRFFDFETEDGVIHPNIKPIKNLHQWRRSCNYLTKEDKSFDLEKEDKMTMTDVVWSCSSITEALMVTPINQAMNVSTVFGQRPREIPKPKITEDMFYPWQKDLKDILFKKADGRSVYWVFEDGGHVGKTRFGEWMCKIHPHKAIMLNNLGKVSDFAEIVRTQEDRGWRGDTVIFNFSRDYQDRTNIYSACETVADGMITCTKYKGDIYWLRDMHVVVFSNFAPQWGKLSADRVKLFTVRNGCFVNLKYEQPLFRGDILNHITPL